MPRINLLKYLLLFRTIKDKGKPLGHFQSISQLTEVGQDRAAENSESQA